MSELLITKNETITEGIDVDWPGWPLYNNPYGDEFDHDARIRMIQGSRKLIPYILQYKHQLRHSLLEIGPFFNPLLKNEEVIGHIPENSFFTFLENDPHAVSWLHKQYACRILNMDMNHPSFNRTLKRSLTNSGYADSFNVIILSQVLNYVNPRNLLRSLYPYLRPGGLVFINNVVDYGIPQLFSEKRPATNDDIKQAAVKAGFGILEERIVPKEFKKEPVARLVLVLSKD